MTVEPYSQHFISKEPNHKILCLYRKGEVRWFEVIQGLNHEEFTNKRTNPLPKEILKIVLIIFSWILLLLLSNYGTAYPNFVFTFVNYAFIAILVGFIIAYYYRIDYYVRLEGDDRRYKPGIKHIISIKQDIEEITQIDGVTYIPSIWVLGYRFRRTTINKERNKYWYHLSLVLTDKTERSLEGVRVRFTYTSPLKAAIKVASESLGRDPEQSVKLDRMKVYGIGEGIGIDDDKIYPEELRKLPKITSDFEGRDEFLNKNKISIICNICNGQFDPDSITLYKPNRITASVILCRNCTKNKIQNDISKEVMAFNFSYNIFSYLVIWFGIVVAYLIIILLLTALLLFLPELGIFFIFGLFGFFLPNVGKLKHTLTDILFLKVDYLDEDLSKINQIYGTSLNNTKISIHYKIMIYSSAIVLTLVDLYYCYLLIKMDFILLLIETTYLMDISSLWLPLLLFSIALYFKQLFGMGVFIQYFKFPRMGYYYLGEEPTGDVHFAQANTGENSSQS